MRTLLSSLLLLVLYIFTAFCKIEDEEDEIQMVQPFDNIQDTFNILEWVNSTRADGHDVCLVIGRNIDNPVKPRNEKLEKCHWMYLFPTNQLLDNNKEILLIPLTADEFTTREMFIQTGQEHFLKGLLDAIVIDTENFPTLGTESPELTTKMLISMLTENGVFIFELESTNIELIDNDSDSIIQLEEFPYLPVSYSESILRHIIKKNLQGQNPSKSEFSDLVEFAQEELTKQVDSLKEQKRDKIMNWLKDRFQNVDFITNKPYPIKVFDEPEVEIDEDGVDFPDYVPYYYCLNRKTFDKSEL